MNHLQERFSQLRSKFQGKNSLFVKTYFMLMLLSLLMIMMIGIWMNQTMAHNHRHEVAQSNLSRLEQAGETMNVIAQTLGQGMTQIMWSNDYITYLILPYQYDTDYLIENSLLDETDDLAEIRAENEEKAQERDFRMVRQLSGAVDSSELVVKAFFYSPVSGMIYDDHSFIRKAELYSDWEVINQHYYGNLPNGQNGPAQFSTTLMRCRDRLFVVQDLEIPSRLGTMVYELNLEYIMQVLGLVGDDGQLAIYVYDYSSEPVFSTVCSYDSWTPEWMNPESFITLENVAAAEERTRGCYSYSDEETGWTYLMPMDTDLLAIHFSDFLSMFLPISLIFLVVSFGFSFYISKSIYRPINRLMNLVAKSGGRKPKGDAEVDFLEGAFSNAIDRQEQLNGIMQSIGPEILEQMLHNLIVGKKLSEQRVSEILDGVGNPIGVRGRFMMLACEMKEPEDRPVTDTEVNLYLLSIRNFVIGLENDSYKVYDLRTGKLNVALLISFTQEEETAVNMKKIAGQIQQQLLQETKNIPCELWVEKSGIYQRLIDIRLAWQEARDKLLYQQYLESGASSDWEEEKDNESSQQVNRRYYHERLNHVADAAAQGDGRTAEQTVQLVLSEIWQDSTGEEDYRKKVETFLDELTEKVITLPLTADDQQTLDSYHSIPETLKKQKSREAMEPYIMEYSRVLIRMIRFYSSKNRYRYVEQAKEYLANNYADSNLSLNEVGEHIGISGSYLSELFNEIAGEKFSGYLAAFRVEKARQLLKSTNVTIKEIGFLCGFNSIQNFIRVFKKYTGVTPGQFRENSL